MSFRDDHDAALARAAALQAELERARADDDRQESRIAELEARLAEADAQRRAAELELAKLRPPPPPSPPPPSPPPPSPPEAAPPVAPRSDRTLWIGGLLLLLMIGVIVANLFDRGESVEEDPPIVARPRPTRVVDEIWPLMTDKLRDLNLGTLAQLTLKGVKEDGSFHDTGELAATLVGKDCWSVRKTTHSDWTIDAVPSTRGPCLAGEMLEPTGAALFPTCSARTIWMLALRDGATSGGVAELRFEHLRWSFQTPGFSRTYPDNCH